MIAGHVKRRLRSAIRSPMFSTFAALLDTLADTRTNLLRVLTYHRIEERSAEPKWNPVTVSATPDEFRRQMKYLATRCRIVSLREVSACAEGESTLPPRSVLITFDDARRDFLQYAAPALAESKLPATLFVPTGYPDNERQTFWWDRIYRCISPDGERTELPTPIGGFRLESQRDRRQALARLTRHYEMLPTDAAETFLDELCESVPLESLGNDVLSWKELRQLAREGVTLGAHTQTHPLLNRTSLSRAQCEIVGSIEDLRRETGLTPDAFAYPGGVLTDDVVAAVAAAGIRLAFTTCRGVNGLSGFDPLRIRRMNVGRATSVSLLQIEMRPGFRCLNPIWSRATA